jgi:ribosomal protein L11 methyltransferase
MPWLQLFADTNNQHAPAIEDALFNAGAASVTFKEHIPHGQQEKPILEPNLGETPLWEHTRVIGLFDADSDTTLIDQGLTQQLPNLSLTLRWEQLEDKDWEREWMKNYHPIQCADNLWICPSWIEPPNPNAINILLDPGLALGTGTHPPHSLLSVYRSGFVLRATAGREMWWGVCLCQMPILDLVVY